MKNFDKPTCEVVKFNETAVIATSTCGCYDEEYDEVYPNNCTGDVAYCDCQINHISGTANCTPCPEFGG